MTKSSGATIKDFTIGQFLGLDTATKNKDEIQSGASPDSLNWITGTGIYKGKLYGDNISLRGGTALLGQTRVAGNGSISGMAIGSLGNGTQIPFFSVGKKMKYYSATSDDTVEIGTDALGSAAANDDVSMVPYTNLGGSWVMVSSPNSSIFKLGVANPGSYINYNSFVFRGKITINQARSFLWNKNTMGGNPDPTGVYLSYIDGALATSSPPFFPKGPSTLATGDGHTVLYSGTLAPSTGFRNLFLVQFAAPIVAATNITAITKSNGAQITAAGNGLSVGDSVIISGVSGMTQINNLIAQVTYIVDTANFVINVDSTSFTAYSSGGTVSKAEIFSDDKSGNMTSNLGGTGTINYISGVYSVTFINPPLNSGTILATYFEEDSSYKGVADFSFTASGRTVGQGAYFRQDDGGGVMGSIHPLSNTFYCFHNTKTWQLNIPTDDTQSTNLIYRDKVGIPNWRAAYATGDGILYVDTTDNSWPVVRTLIVNFATSLTNPSIIPKSISDSLDLSGQGFDKSVAFEWGDYYLVSCKNSHNGVADINNDAVYIYNKLTGFWDKTDFRANVFGNYNGALLAGDSASPNVFNIFSGVDDDGYNINNYWTSAPMTLGADGMKRFNRFVIRGMIQLSQSIDVYLSYDNGTFSKVFTLLGNSQYVNQGSPTTIGGNTCGSKIVGGGGEINAFPYEAEINIGSDIFNKVAIKFVASNVGYAQIDSFTFKDIRYKSKRIIPNLN